VKLLRKLGSTSQILQIFIQDSSSATGAGLTGLTNASGSLTAYYHRDTDTTATAISLVTMTVGTFTSSGFKEIDSTNMPGWYQFCPPNAALASGAASVALHLKGASNMAPVPIEIDLDGQIDVTSWNGTAVSSPATAGIPDVNVKNINNVATTAVTTIGANQGTTQPINFTGTGASALAKSDMVDIAGSAVSTGTAQIGVNVVSQNNIDFGALQKASLNAATPASVVGAVGSVTGNVGGNVTGSVGSVVGLTASNLDTTISSRMATYAQPTGFLAATFPTGTIANTTNITAGTITTATNLTNAPTSGDFTITMKTSLNAATPASITGAVGSVTGNVGGNVVGSVGSVVGLTVANLDVAVSTRLATSAYTAPNNAGISTIISDLAAGVIVTTNNDKTGYALSSAGNNAVVSDIFTTNMTEGYPTVGQAFTLAQGIYNINQQMGQMSIVGTLMTTKKRDQSTTAKTFTLDSSTIPSQIVETT